MECNQKSLRLLSIAGARGACAKALEEIFEKDDTSILVTADVLHFSNLEKLQERFPDRVLNVGIAEQNMIGIAAGLAKDKWNVFVTTYANFVTMRSFEQVRLNLGYMQFPVKVIGSSAGLGMGVLGNTHYGIEDMSLMRAIPGMTVLSPADGLETVKAVLAASEYDHPLYLRLTGEMNQGIVYREDYDFRIGVPVEVHKGSDVVLFATGTMVSQALKAADILKEQHIGASVVNVHTIKPLEKEVIFPFLEGKRLYAAIEEHTVIGGLGSAIMELFEGDCVCPGIRIGIPDTFLKVGSYNYLLEQCGLLSEQIAERVLTELQKER